MYNYLVTFYNYLLSFFMTTKPVETWEDVYKTIEPSLSDLAEKMTALDKLFYCKPDGWNEQIEEMFIDVAKDFRAIQQVIIRVKNMHVVDEELADRNNKVSDAAIYLQHELDLFRHQQQVYLKLENNADKINAAIDDIYATFEKMEVIKVFHFNF